MSSRSLGVVDHLCIEIIRYTSHQKKRHCNGSLGVERWERSKYLVGAKSYVRIMTLYGSHGMPTSDSRESRLACVSAEQQCTEYSDAARTQIENPTSARPLATAVCKHRVSTQMGKRRAPRASPWKRGTQPAWVPRSPGIDQPVEGPYELHPWSRECTQGILE